MRYEKKMTREEGGDDYGNGAITVEDCGVRIFENGRGIAFVTSAPDVIADFSYPPADEVPMIAKLEADGWQKVEVA